jgi:hypothetical protein
VNVSVEEIEAAQRLSEAERARLVELEATIAAGVRSFTQTGWALAEIRDSRLYRERYATFEAYTLAEWGFRRSYAYEIMQASEVAEQVSGIPDAPAPRNAGVAAELVPLRGEPEQLARVWSEANSAAAAAERPVTAQDVKDARKRLAPSTAAPAREVPAAVAPAGDPSSDLRFAHIEEGVQILRMLPAPDRVVWPVDEGDREAVGEAVEWLAKFAPALARAWREDQRSRRRLRVV